MNALHRPPHSKAMNGSERAQFVRSQADFGEKCRDYRHNAVLGIIPAMPDLISAKIATIITRTVSIRELIHASSAPTCPAGRSIFIRSIPAGEGGPRRFVISETYLSSVRSIKPGRRVTGIRVRFLRGSPRRRQACKSPAHGTGR